jgi:hypothetical protein
VISVTRRCPKCGAEIPANAPDLALGRNADALRLSKQATDSLPVEKDAMEGPNFQVGLAQIEARTGAPEEAIKRLQRLLSILAGGAVSIAALKINPVWDPIRKRPDFSSCSQLRSRSDLTSNTSGSWKLLCPTQTAQRLQRRNRLCSCGLFANAGR